MSQHLSLPKDKIRFLLLEGVHQNAIDTLNAAGYTNIDYRKTALEGEALKEAIKDALNTILRNAYPCICYMQNNMQGFD